VVWNYILGDVVNLDTMSEAEREIVREEADFYQVQSLLKFLVPPPQFNTVFKGSPVYFSSNNTVAKRSAEAGGTKPSYVMSSTPFLIPEHVDFAEKTIKLVSRITMFPLFFGLAPAKFMSDPLLHIENCGNHCNTNLFLYAESVKNGVQFKYRSMNQDDVLQLRLHRDKTVSIVFNSEDLGVAFRDVSITEPLYVVARMRSRGDCVELLPDLG
jgi:hypothetical protein